MKKVVRHITHYTSLIGILGAGVLAFWLFSYDQNFQAGVAVAVAASYITWGIIHHSIHKDLYLSVVLEYFLFAILGLVIIFSLIFR